MKTYRLIFIIGLMSLLSGCISEPELKDPFSNFEPVKIKNGWEISSPSEEGIDSLGLVKIFNDFHNNEEIWQVRSLSVYRNGKLVAESYTKDPSDRYEPRAIWSCTKQFIGVLVGIAVDKGLINSIDDKIEKYLPEILKDYPDKKNITIKHLLTMNSGISYNNYGLSGDDSKILQQIPDNYLKFVLEKKLNTEPGTDYDYKDSDPQILSSIIQKVTGKPTDVWAEEILFSKIDFDNFEWKRYKDGTTLGSFGIITTPREMAKLAQTVLNGGTYSGQKVVSERWVEQMVYPHEEAGDKNFGFLWWSYPEYETYFMSGNGRQLVFVIPEKDLIVVITSEPNVQGKYNLSTVVGRDYTMRIKDLCN